MSVLDQRLQILNPGSTAQAETLLGALSPGKIERKRLAISVSCLPGCSLDVLAQHRSGISSDTQTTGLPSTEGKPQSGEAGLSYKDVKAAWVRLRARGNGTAAVVWAQAGVPELQGPGAAFLRLRSGQGLRGYKECRIALMRGDIAHCQVNGTAGAKEGKISWPVLYALPRNGLRFALF